jgi:hypothetical protein
MYAEVPREMVATGDWVTPHANGVRYLEKPPLLYWLTAASYEAFGTNEVAARLPVALASVATILLAFLLAELCFGAGAGLWAGLALALAPGYYLFSQQLMPDTLITALLSLALYGFLRGFKDGSASGRWYGLFWAALGLLILTKGLIGLLFPLGIVFLFLVIANRLSEVAVLRPGRGLLVTLAIAAPWHVMVGLLNPGFAWFYFINEHVLRFLGLRYPKDYGTVPLAAFWGMHVAWFYPWLLLLPLGVGLPSVKGIWRRVRSASGVGADRAGDASTLPGPEGRWPLTAFPAIWALVVLLFFSFSTRLEYYSLPAYPALAVLLGGAIARLTRRPEGLPSRRFVGACAVMAAVGALAQVAAIALLAYVHRYQGASQSLIDPKAPYNIYFFSPVLELSPRAFHVMEPSILAISGALFLGSLAAYLLARGGRSTKALAALVLSSLVVLPGIQLCNAAFGDDLSSRSLAAAYRQAASKDDLLVVDGQFELHSSLAFYSGHQLLIREGRKGYLWWGSRYPDCPKVFLTDAQFGELWNGPRRVFYVSRQGAPPPMGPRRPRRVAASDNQLLMDNQG